MYILRTPRTGKLTQGNSCPEWSVYSVDMNYPELCGAGSCLAWWLQSHLHRRVSAHTLFTLETTAMAQALKPGQPGLILAPYIPVDLGHVTLPL
jgi:hypothetical protein